MHNKFEFKAYFEIKLCSLHAIVLIQNPISQNQIILYILKKKIIENILFTKSFLRCKKSAGKKIMHVNRNSPALKNNFLFFLIMKKYLNKSVHITK